MDGKRIVSGSSDMTVCVWDAKSGTSVSGPFEGHYSDISLVALLSDVKRVVSASYVWQHLYCWKPLSLFQFLSNLLYSLADERHLKHPFLIPSSSYQGLICPTFQAIQEIPGI